MLCPTRLAASLALVGLLSAPATATEATPARMVDLTYDVYLGGLHIFSFDVAMNLQPDHYRVTADGKTRGMAGFLYGWDVKMKAEGLDAGAIEPQLYVTDSAWKGKRRTSALTFGPEGDYDLTRDPPPEPDPEIEGGLPKALPEDTVDPLSLAIVASRALETTGRCDQTLPVFDGQRRYNLTLKHVGEGVLPPSGYGIYEGRAISCTFSIERISGFRKTSRSARQLEAGAAIPPTLWMAPIHHLLPPVPVRYEGEIPLGKMVIHLTDAKVRTELGEVVR